MRWWSCEEFAAARRERESRTFVAGARLIIRAEGRCCFHDEGAITSTIVRVVVIFFFAESPPARTVSESTALRHEQPPRGRLGRGRCVRTSVPLCAPNASIAATLARTHLIFIVVNPPQTGHGIDEFIFPETGCVNLIAIVERVNERRRRPTSGLESVD